VDVEPNLILQVPINVSGRFKDHLEGLGCLVCFVPPKASIVLLFVQSPQPEAIVASLVADEFAGRMLHRVFPVHGRAASLSEVLEGVAASLEGVTLRVQMWPKKRELELIELMDAEVAVDPKAFTHVLFVVAAMGRYYYALASAEEHHLGNIPARHIDDDALCRAMYKIKEATVRCNVPLQADWTTLDLGASPGGWVQYLAQHVGKVVAVDPGEVALPAHGMAEVVHIKRLSEDAMEEIVQHGPYQLLCSDMNVHPEKAAGIMATLAPHLVPRGFLVLTLKFVMKGKRNEEKMQEQAISTLGTYFDHFEIIWLFSNQSGEKTLLARRKEDPGAKSM